MRREYEALSKLVGKNFAVLEDGMGVYLTPKGEVRDIDGRLLLPELEGRARLFERNLAGGGGTSDAVQYIPQELTESQQMQARKNLGVYWKGKTTQTVYNGVLDQGGENGDGTKAIVFADDYSRPNVLEAGKRYSVTVNGETFDNLLCVEGTEMEGLPACFLGNMSICRTMGSPPNEDDNGLPFGVMSCEYVTSVRCLVDKDPDDYFESTEDFMKDTSVKIEGVSESITTIPPEYLLVPTIWVNSDGTKYLSCTVDQLNQCFEAGIMLLMRYTDDGYTYCCQVAGRMDDKFGFTFAEDVVLHVSYADGTVTEGGGK